MYRNSLEHIPSAFSQKYGPLENYKSNNSHKNLDLSKPSDLKIYQGLIKDIRPVLVERFGNN